MRSRVALTLFEVALAIALFATLMVAVIETSINVRAFSEQYEDLIDLEREGRAILSTVTNDLSNSGWYSNAGVNLPSVSTPLPATFGNSVKFLRIRSVPNNLPGLGIGRFDFSAPVTPMENWKQPVTTVPGLVADEAFVNNGPSRLVTPVWEPTTALRGTSLTYAENRDPINLRIYRYQVDPTPVTGRGTLRRYISEDAGVTFVVDPDFSELGSHIFDFVVTLSPGTQRVRLSLELRKDVPGKARANRRFDAVIAMRSAY